MLQRLNPESATIFSGKMERLVDAGLIECARMIFHLRSYLLYVEMRGILWRIGSLQDKCLTARLHSHNSINLSDPGR